jgi:hypothetical protein
MRSPASWSKAGASLGAWSRSSVFQYPTQHISKLYGAFSIFWRLWAHDLIMVCPDEYALLVEESSKTNASVMVSDRLTVTLELVCANNNLKCRDQEMLWQARCEQV